MTLRDVGLRIASDAERVVLRLHERLRQGDLTRPQFEALAAAAIARANARAITAADLAVVAAIAAALGEARPPAGIEVDNDQQRLRDAVRSVLDADVASALTVTEAVESTELRLARVARAEPLSMVQTALVLAMGAQQVSGWRRVTGPDPCPLCRQWADDVVRPPTVRMARHHGCSCMAQPVFS